MIQCDSSVEEEHMVMRHGWATFVLLGVGCSTPPSFIGPLEPDASADAGPSAMTACANLAVAECAELETCSSVVMKLRYGTVTMCQARLTTSCARSLDAPSTGNTAKKVQACAEAYPTWACSDFLGNINLPAACAQPAGDVANGAACAFSAQCTTGFCAIAPHTACGTCGLPPKLGDSCASLSTCGQRLICLTSNRVCGTFGVLGAACSKDAPCGAHLSCVGADAAKGSPGTCQSSAGLAGAACDPTLVKGPGCDFDGGLVCNSLSKTCDTLAISAAGGACDFASHQIASCLASGACSTSEGGATGMCLSAAADGQTCSTTSAGPGCMPPARCVVTSDASTSGTCEDDGTTACK